MIVGVSELQSEPRIQNGLTQSAGVCVSLLSGQGDLSGLDRAAPNAGVGNAPTVEDTEPPLPLKHQPLPRDRLRGGGQMTDLLT